VTDATPRRRGLARLTRPPIALPPRQWQVLLLVGVAFLINQYDLGVFGLALPRIQASLGISESEIGNVTALIRIGVLPAFALAMLADRHGRRRMLMITIVGVALSNLATAFAPDPASFVICQISARSFIGAEEMLSVVVVAEELDPRVRGWAIGALGALGSMGHGVAALMFGMVDILPYGWRSLYFLAAVPLLALAFLRRRLTETTRFAEYRDSGPPASTLAPLIALARAHPLRVAILAAAVAPVAFALAPSLLYVSKHLQVDEGYSPAAVSLLYLTGGAVAMLGNLAGGRLADRLGRRAVLTAAALISPALFAVFYGSSGSIVPVAWIGAIFAYFCVDVTLSALSTELFPTSSRATASAGRSLIWSVSAAGGLWAQGALLALAGSASMATIWVLALAPLTALVVLLAMPETAGRTLEEIAPERPL
jgi:putative MFS transporter